MPIGMPSPPSLTTTFGDFATSRMPTLGRLRLLNGLVSSLGLPLAGILFSVLLRHQPAVSDAAKTGAKISTGLGDMIESGMLGFVGFFLSAIFLLLAFAILRNAPRPSLSGRGVPD